MSSETDEKGQSALLIALIVVVLLTLLGIVVDAGNAYAHRRMVQAAVDEATLAAVLELGETGVEGKTVSQGHVFGIIEKTAEARGLAGQDVRAWFIDGSGSRIGAIGRSANPVPGDAQGVEVAGDVEFETYFAHLLGVQELRASTAASAWLWTAPCRGENLIPMAVGVNTFGPSGKPVPGTVYTLWNLFERPAAPGHFGWLYWVDGEGHNRCPEPNCKQSGAATALADNIAKTSRSGRWEMGDRVSGSGDAGMSAVLDVLKPYVRDDRQVLVPIYDEVTGPADSPAHTIAGFGAFRLNCAYSSETQYVERTTGACGPCNDSGAGHQCLRGEFVRMVVATGPGGCIDTGLVLPSFQTPTKP